MMGKLGKVRGYAQQRKLMNSDMARMDGQQHDLIPLLVGKGADQRRVDEIADKLSIAPVIKPEDFDQSQLHLLYDEKGLSLRQGSIAMQGDFTQMLPRLKRGKVESEMLYKASKIKGLEGIKTAMDATAGLGEDSMLLAAAGYTVELFEKNPVIAALLEDALIRALKIPELAAMSSRMHLHTEDSIEYMVSQEKGPDLIYLDPMFPARQKSGLIKKKFQLLQQLESPEMNGEEMLAAAMGLKPTRIVVKRPLKGELLGGQKPSFSLQGKAIRYDCFVNIRG